MSRTSMEEVTCPRCGKKSPYQIWESVNTMLNPEMKQAVRDGSAFLFTCPHCGNTSHVEYGFLYHQMEDEIMIYVVSSDDGIEEALSLMNDVRLDEIKKTFKIESHFLNRIVVTQNCLREKLAIFDSGLDDRIVEIYKLLLLVKYQKEHPDAGQIQLLYYQEPAGNRGVEVIVNDNSIGAFEFSNEVYDHISSEFLPKMKDIRDDEPLIDRQWAIQMLKTIRSGT